jgi:flagellin-specific chaperone FliS
MRKLSEANIEKKIKPLDEVLRIFLDLTSAWMEKMKKDSQEHAKSRIESTPAERSSGLEIYG